MELYRTASFFGSKHPHAVSLQNHAWCGTNAAHTTSARIRRSDTPKQESTFTTSQKRDTQRAQFVRGDSYWTFVPKVDVGPFEGAATKPKRICHSQRWRRVAPSEGATAKPGRTSPPNRPDQKGAKKRSRSRNSLVPNVDLHQ